MAAPPRHFFQADFLSVLRSFDVSLYTFAALSDQILTVMGKELDSEGSPSTCQDEYRSAILNYAAR